MERRIISARARARAAGPTPTDWQAAAAVLEGEYGERWSPVEPGPDLGDLLGKVE